MKKKKGGKRRTSTTKTYRRRRRGISGVGSVVSVSTQLLSAVGGAVVSKALNGVAKEVDFLKKSKYALPIIKGVGAYFLLTSKQPILKDAGIGVAAEAGLQLLESAAPKVFQKLTGGFTAVSGIGSGNTRYLDLDDMQVNRGVGAYGEDAAVSGYGEEFEMAGVQ